MSATMTTTIATSNLRGTSRQTRTNPTRTSKVVGNTLRQNSLISNPPAPPPIANEPHGFYPAIQHFTDSIAALPRDYRRHTSLLQEVDSKAWAPEEHLQTLLTQCLAAPPLHPTVGSTHSVSEVASANNDEGQNPATADDAVQQIPQATDPAVTQRRQLYTSLQLTLRQMMVTMDEKNHVVNNANEELSRHLRRLNDILPHLAVEISEEARLGSLKHWAYFETNITRKAQSSRREAAASLAIMHDTDIARRSESRREAVLARKQRLNQVDSDFDDTGVVPRRGNASTKGRRAGEAATEPTGLGISALNVGKKKKPEKSIAGTVGMERSLSGALGGRSMSREPSQQEGVSKKRKAPTSGTTVARKRHASLGIWASTANGTSNRLNANTHDSPKLASSPLAGSFGKEAYKRSPIPSTARPVNSRVRQNSNQQIENSRARPSSSASHRTNGNAGTASTPELHHVAAMTGKSTAGVKNTLKESTSSRGDKLLEEDAAATNGMSGGILLERSSSRSGTLKREANASDESLATKSPRLPAPLSIFTADRNGRGRVSKTSTPVIGTFAESDASESVAAGSNGDNGNGKLKRPTRPRVKDHGLHDSLSPKALPPKRSHKKGAGILAQQQAQRVAAEDATGASSATPDGGVEGEDDEENDYGEGEVEEQRYCYCNEFSYGEMVACDNKDCKKEWFHLDCVGLKKPPSEKTKWYCNDCRDKVVARGKLGSLSNGSIGGNGGNGNGNGKR